ncbi:MAG: PEP-CTERM sorting domain-containing protein [Verrucomicrobiota bacterium]
MRNFIYAATAAAILCSSAHAQVSVITGIDTTPAFASPETDNVTLTGFSTASNTYNFQYTVASLTGTAPTATTWGTAGTQPVDGSASLLDDSPITGSLSTADSLVYNFGQSVSAADNVFVIFNGSISPTFFDHNTTITALDGGGSQVGSVLNVSILFTENFGTANLSRSNGGDLFGRGLYGWTANIADFGGDPSEIASVRLGISQTGFANVVDIQQVGVATVIPEPSTYALLGGLTVLGIAFIRRRRK